MTDIRISASGLETFFSCPAKYSYSREWTLVGDLDPAIQQGLNVHQKLEGRNIDLTPPENKHYTEIHRVIDDFNYLIVGHEFEQVFEIAPGIQLKRIIDALAWYDDRPVLIDYKTTSKMWDNIRGTKVVAKASNFQAVAYLIAPPDPTPYPKWATEIHFLVSDGRKCNVIPFFWNKSLENNFISACKSVQRATEDNNFPKYIGFGCNYCNYMPICFKQKNWEKLYVEREKT